MTGSRRLAIVFALQAILFAIVGLVALDLYAHKKLDTLAGRNIWGYRGAVARLKQPREIRIEIVGGTRAFGLGMPASWTIGTVLRQQVMLVTDRKGGEIRQVVPLTLAHPGALPDSYAATIEHYAYLDPDYVCIVDDLGVGGGPLPEEMSGVFAHIGYWPLLPLALQEKGGLRQWRPLMAAGNLLERVDRLLARPPAVHSADDPGRYTSQMLQAVDVALAHARGVVVVLTPEESPRQSANLSAVLPALAAKSAKTANLRIVNLAGEPLLLDPSQRLAGGWNYGGDAIAAAAKAITPAILELIAR